MFVVVARELVEAHELRRRTFVFLVFFSFRFIRLTRSLARSFVRSMYHCVSCRTATLVLMRRPVPNMQ